MGEFPSGQRGQTVNLLLYASMVRIHPLPPRNGYKKDIARENPDFIGVFTVLYGKILAIDFVDVNQRFIVK